MYKIKSLLPKAQWLTHQRLSGSVAQCTKKKKKKKRRGDVAHVRGTKNKIKLLREPHLTIFFKKKKNQTKLIKKKKKQKC